MREVMGPPGAQGTQLQKMANRALGDYEKELSELRDIQALFRCKKILKTGSAGMTPQQPKASPVT